MPPDRSKRREARECATQVLFGMDFTHASPAEALPAFWEEQPADEAVRAYAGKLVEGFAREQEHVDAAIDSALARWQASRVGRIERAVLRMAVYEMLYERDVPAPVAINEALEVTKAFGTDESPRFVNGVLDRVQKNRDAESTANPAG